MTGISTNTSGLPHLFSKGEAVLYSVSGGTLTAFVDGNANGTFEGTDRTVFTLTVNGDGSWSFDLKDQLDHVAGSGDAGYLLRTSLNDAVGVTSIDFSWILTATDKDGDTKTGATAGKFACNRERSSDCGEQPLIPPVSSRLQQAMSSPEPTSSAATSISRTAARTMSAPMSPARLPN